MLDALKRDYRTAKAKERKTNPRNIRTAGKGADAKEFKAIRRALGTKTKAVHWDYTRKRIPGDSKQSRELQKIRNKLLDPKQAKSAKALRKELDAMKIRGKGERAKALRRVRSALKAASHNVAALGRRFDMLVRLGRVSPEHRQEYITRWMGG